MTRLPLIACALALLCAGCERPLEPGELDFGSCRYPIIYEGESIRGGGRLVVEGTFEPVFGADRACVNPARPEHRGDRLRFDEPGEYYLRLNGDRALKVLVLSRDEPASEAVTRLFDFCTANMVPMSGNNDAWYEDADAMVDGWFRGDQPIMILCGPTYGVFKRLIDERFGLPIRVVTFPGIYRTRGVLQKSTHNVAEVYLPDVGKWVLFDVNNAFMVQWKSALELSALIKEATRDNELMTADEWKSLKLPIHLGAPLAFRPVGAMTESERFHDEFLRPTTVRDTWRRLSGLYLGGPAYFGGDGYNTSFLPAAYNFASFHDDPELEQAAVDWIRTFDIEIAVFSGEEMTAMLEEGHREAVAEASRR